MSGSSRSAWKSGVVVSMPSTMSSESARRRRASASVAGAAVDDQLADQAVVVGRDGVAVVDGAVHAHAEAAGGVVGADLAGRGLEVRQLLGVDPALDGVAGGLELGLGEGHRQAGGDADLLLDEVDVVDRLGDRMLDLEAGVHLDEVELAVLVEELDGAGAGVVDLGDGVGADPGRSGRGCVASMTGEGASSSTFWWRRCSEQSRSPRWTAPPLPSPKTWTSMWRGVDEVLLEIDLVVAEGGLGLGAGGLEGGLDLVGGAVASFMPRPPPPAVALTITG